MIDHSQLKTLEDLLKRYYLNILNIEIIHLLLDKLIFMIFIKLNIKENNKHITNNIFR